MNQSDKDRIIVGSALLGSIGAVVGVDKYDQFKKSQKVKKAITLSRQRVRSVAVRKAVIDKVDNTLVSPISKNAQPKLHQRLLSGGKYPKVPTANQNVKSANVTSLSDKGLDPRVHNPRGGTKAAEVPPKVANKAVNIIKPTMENNLHKSPNAANQNLTKIKRYMGRAFSAVKASSVVGAISYGLSSTPTASAEQSMMNPNIKYKRTK